MMRLSLLLALLAGPVWAASAPDPVLGELKPELERNLAGLRLPGQPRPYYLGFSHMALDRLEVVARLGDIVLDDLGRQTYLHARIRVGSTDMDNANYAGYAGWNGTVQITALEGAGAPLRRDAWLAADSAFKRALEAYAAKEAALKRDRRKDRPPEFSADPPTVRMDGEGAIGGVERAQAREIGRQISGVFREFPKIQQAEVRIRVRSDTARFLDSDGFAYRQPVRMAQLLVTAASQSREGVPLREVFSIVVPALAGLPGLPDLTGRTRELADRLVERAQAPDLPAPYLGPVLFTPQAAAEFFRQTAAEDFCGTPSPVSEGGGMMGLSGGGLLARFLGLRIMPEWMDVAAEPGRREWEGILLPGGYAVDREGVPGRRVELVREGRLLNFLMSRTPSEEFKSSNGHGRLAAGNMVRAAPSNLIVQARRSYPHPKLKKILLKLAKRDGLAFALIVRRLDEPAEGMPVRRISLGGGAEDPEEAPSRWAISPALDVCRVDVKTGEETRLRGALFGPIGVPELRGIAAAGREYAVYSFIVQPGRTDFYQGFTEDAVASVVVPALLFSQLEVRSPGDKQKPLPLLEHPLLAAPGN